MELKNKKICFLGDSITFGVGTSCGDAMFPNLVGKECGAAAVYNHGISGNRIARQSDGEDIGGCMADRFREMEDDADVVVVFGGTNDYATATRRSAHRKTARPIRFMAHVTRCLPDCLKNIRTH